MYHFVQKILKSLVLTRANFLIKTCVWILCKKTCACKYIFWFNEKRIQDILLTFFSTKKAPRILMLSYEWQRNQKIQNPNDNQSTVGDNNRETKSIYLITYNSKGDKLTAGVKYLRKILYSRMCPFFLVFFGVLVYISSDQRIKFIRAYSA